jgi:hypothetical protein
MKYRQFVLRVSPNLSRRAKLSANDFKQFEYLDITGFVSACECVEAQFNWWRNAVISTSMAAWPRSVVRRELNVINIRSSTVQEAYRSCVYKFNISKADGFLGMHR